MAIACLERGRLQIDVEPLLEAILQPVSEWAYIGNRSITGKYHLFVGVVHAIKGVE